MERVLKLALEDISERFRTLIPVWLLGTGADFGRLNLYARHLSFGLLVILFYQELVDDVNRTREDMIKAVKKLAGAFKINCENEEAEKIVDALLVSTDSKKHTFAFQEHLFNEKKGEWENFRFQYLEIDRDASDLDEGHLVYKLSEISQGLFLNTNEIQKQLPIDIQTLIVELLIEKGELKTALRMLDALNHRALTLLKEEKIHRDELLRNPKETLFKHKHRWNLQLHEVELQFQEEAEKYAKLDRILKRISVAAEYQTTYIQLSKRLTKTRKLHDSLAKSVIENIRLEMEMRNKQFRNMWLGNVSSFRKSIWEEQAKASGFSHPNDMLDLVECIFSPYKPSILPLEWGIDNQMELPLNTFSGPSTTHINPLEPVEMDWEAILLLWKPVFAILVEKGEVSLKYLQELDEFTLARWIENREAFDFWLALASAEEPFHITEMNLQNENDDIALLISKLINSNPEFSLLLNKVIGRITTTDEAKFRNKVDVTAYILTLEDE
ncbi:hypothetical protein [Rossellomorea aquimaris]|uniref:Uncharacterized protein n=1 Tax=Rossellomorea aquimaris TaxID=189382 RepID=A0A5D4TLM4_9BACI|nr:hypothetical protein [Rossellomorea aquimaris]TYS76587.1 hypothetical protein FZC80_14890 [Rossellomorea aquimaris]